ncbi:hypothetical protein BsIDN1_66860 [Bacillus safensis]|uniref:PTS EIIB type-1 domain-containing protein n=1 Tax=Bacillus safensis TaxID=561879 RepID=A0A5S9MIY5_BACIA|nr:hypothetical protein BsIDN1_66860 [Bacillus safensis]
MDYQKTAKELTKLLGGKENVISATHCATRLRLVVKNEDLIDKEAIEELEGVKGAFSSSGQFQVIFGTGSVNKVYEPFARETGLETGDEKQKKPVSHDEAVKQKNESTCAFCKDVIEYFCTNHSSNCGKRFVNGSLRYDESLQMG